MAIRGLQHAELQRLVALLLAAGQVDVQLTGEEALVEPDARRLGADERRDRFGVAVTGDEGRREHGVERHAGHLGRVLHGEEQAGLGPLPRGHGEHVLAVERDRAAE